MRSFIFAATLAAIAMPAAALAQVQVQPAQNPTNAPNIKSAGGQAVVITAEHIAQRVAALRANYAANKRPNTNEGILFAGGYKLTLELRTGRQGSLTHNDNAELLFILQGSGTVTTGGALVDARPPNNGNTPGSGITGGAEQRVVAGDMMLVPQGTPHTFAPDDAGLVFVTTYLPRTGRFAPATGGEPAKLFNAAANLPAMMAKAKPGAGVPPRYMGTDTFLSLPPYRAGLEYRGAPGNAAVHDNNGEFMVVVDGSGVIETGGAIVKSDNGRSVIQGATVTPIKKGDFIFVPSGVPHLPHSTGDLVLATMHVPAD